MFFFLPDESKSKEICHGIFLMATWTFRFGFSCETSGEYGEGSWKGECDLTPENESPSSQSKNLHDVELVRWCTLACELFGGDVPWFGMVMLVYRSVPLPKTNMTMENPPVEDVFPIENGDFPMSC